MQVKMDVYDPNFIERTVTLRSSSCPIDSILKNNAQICLQYKFPSTKTYIFTTKIFNSRIDFDLNSNYDSKTEPEVERRYGYAGNYRV